MYEAIQAINHLAYVTVNCYEKIIIKYRPKGLHGHSDTS